MKRPSQTAARLSTRTVRALRLLSAGSGAVAVVGALAVHRMGSPSTAFLLVVAGLALTGASVAGRRALSAYTGAAVLVLNTLTLLVMVELVASGARLACCHAPAPGPLSVTAAPVPYYEDQPWASDFWNEHVALDTLVTRYHPFVLWRSPPFEGRYINISDEGVRRTHTEPCSGTSFTVFVVGGSAAWGWGAPDSLTIPSYLDRALATTRPDRCVVNLGQNAYVSSQEVIELQRQLQSGTVPDLVVFYHGFNDAHAASLSGRAGTHYGQDRIAARLENRGPDTVSPVLELVRRTATFSLLSGLRESAPSVVAMVPENPGDSTPVDAELVRRTVGTYLTNHRVVDALSRAYGFEYAFFWQPALDLMSRPLTPQEEVLAGSPLVAGSLPFLAEVYREIEGIAREEPRIFFLGAVFESAPPDVWLDFVHTTPEGNRILVDTMVSRLGMDGVTADGARAR